MDFMHKRGIIHRDIKLDNILINRICQETEDIEVVISDLGVAKKFIPSEGQ
jgi:serine/threonine protein kinase